MSAAVPGPDDQQQPPSRPAPSPPSGLLGRYPWVPFVVPYVLYLLITALEPAPPAEQLATGTVATAPQATVELPAEPAVTPEPAAETATEEAPAGLLRYEHYPLIYTAKIVLVLVLLGLLWPALRQFPLRFSIWGPITGVVGIIIWIAFTLPPVQQAVGSLLTSIGLGDMAQHRTGFNPLEELREYGLLAYGFLLVRFLGLVVVVAVIEELFFRGFVMRFISGKDWTQVPIGQGDAMALGISTLLFAAAHPLTEVLAATSWFLLVSLLALRTGNIWDCVAAHATTNLLLGLYVLATGAWYLM